MGDAARNTSTSAGHADVQVLWMHLMLVCCRGPIASEVGGRDVAETPLKAIRANNSNGTALVGLQAFKRAPGPHLSAMLVMLVLCSVLQCGSHLAVFY